MVLTIIIGVLVVVLVVMIVFMSTPPKPRLLMGDSPRDHGADAEIEDSDIDQMIEARNERRRRLGRPEIGDELARELQERRRPL